MGSNRFFVKLHAHYKKLPTIFAKHPMLDVLQGSKYVSKLNKSQRKSLGTLWIYFEIQILLTLCNNVLKLLDILCKSCRLCLCGTPNKKQTGSAHCVKSVHIRSFLVCIFPHS